MQIICKEHGVFEQSPNNHLAGKNCPECAKLIKSQKLKCSNQELINKFINKHGDKYDYSLVQRDDTNRVKIICKEHGIFEQHISKHLSGRGCPTCGGSKKLETHDVIRTFINIHGNKYDYSLVNYINSKTKIKIICKEHGIFEQDYSKHVIGRGCPTCGGSKKLESFEVVQKFKNVHGDKYDYSLIDRASRKFKIICKEHGVFEQDYSNHINGKGCPSCSNRVSSKEREIKDIFKNTFISSDRSLIKPLEIDLISYDYKFGIEYNGVMYHSSGISTVSKFNKFIDEKYHINKTDMMEKVGYQLFHIFDTEFLHNSKKEIWLSKINDKLGIYNKEINSNDCVFKRISYNDTKNFLILNHIDGMITAKFNYGLYYNNKLILVCCFNINNKECIISRLSIKNNIKINGYEMYMLKYISNNFNVSNIIKIENRRWDSFLNDSCFRLIKTTEPNCYYFKQKGLKLFKIKNNETVKLKLINTGCRLIYDSGYNIYEYKV